MPTQVPRAPGANQRPAAGPQAPPMAAIIAVLAAIVLVDLALAVTRYGHSAHKAKAATRVTTRPAPATAPRVKAAPSTLPLFTAPSTPGDGTTSPAGAPGGGVAPAGSPGGGSTPGPSGQLYTITQALPVRDTPSDSGTTLETIAAGAMVGVQCKASGTVVNGPYGPDPWWDKVAYGSVTGYVTDEYVDTKGDEGDNTKVPPC